MQEWIGCSRVLRMVNARQFRVGDGLHSALWADLRGLQQRPTETAQGISQVVFSVSDS